MFDTENVGFRVDRIDHQRMEKDDADIPLVVVTLLRDPLTVELAAEIDPFMRNTLFTMAEAVVTPKLAGADFDVVTLPQQLAFRGAPDQGDADFVIREGKLGTLKARRTKKGQGWKLTFTVTFTPDGEHQLAQVVDSYTKHRYITFADARADLFSESAKQERKARRAAAAGVGSATAH